MENDFVKDDRIKFAKKDRVFDIFKNLPLLETPMQQESKK